MRVQNIVSLMNIFKKTTMKKSEKINVENLLGMGFKELSDCPFLYYIKVGEYRGLINNYHVYYDSNEGGNFTIMSRILSFSTISEIKKFISHFK